MSKEYKPNLRINLELIFRNATKQKPKKMKK